MTYDDSVLKTTLPGFGILDREYPTDKDFDPNRQKKQWERFQHYLTHLNATEGPQVQYKLIYAARHGQGVHNAFIDSVPHTEWEVSRRPFQPS